MSEKYCVFLRGVNVNGVKMKMDELKRAFAGLSFPEAKTILATGNVIISSDGDTAGLKEMIEKGLSAYFKYEASVFLRSAPALTDILSAAETVSVPESSHLYYLVCDSAETLAELATLFSELPHKNGEAFVPTDSGGFWAVPVGETLDSVFGSKVLGGKKYKNLLTSRNISTIKKIVSAMGE